MIMNSILGLEAGAVGRKSVEPTQGAEKTSNFSDFTDALAASEEAEEAAAASVEGDDPQGDSVLVDADSKPETNDEPDLTISAEQEPTSVSDETAGELREEVPSEAAGFVEAPQVADQRVSDRMQDQPKELTIQKHVSGKEPPRPAVEAEGSEDSPKSGRESEASRFPRAISSEQADNPRIAPAEQSAEVGKSAESGKVGDREAGSAEAQMAVRTSATVTDGGVVEKVGQRASNPSNVVPEQTTTTATAAAQVAATVGKQVQTDLSERKLVQARETVSIEGTTVGKGQTSANPSAAIASIAAATTGTPKSDIQQGITEQRDVAPTTETDEPVTSVKTETSSASRYDVRVSGSPQTQAQQPGSVSTMSQFSLMTGGNAFSGAETGPLSASFEMTSEMPGLSQLLTEATFGTSATHRSELPRMVASQMAEAFAAKGEQKVEVSLNPQELGKVSMRVVTSETGITMVIQTERPETGDLMRRHIHELAEEFRQMGYEDISFEFSGGQADGGQSQDQSAGGSANADSLHMTEVAEPAVQNLQLGAAGLDMRV
jgi:flagellar hook-length control protein FliK